MDINTILSSQESAYVIGVVAAFTPCTFSMIPIFLYRFGLLGKKDERKPKLVWQLTLVVVGFLLSFSLTGLVFQELSGSDFVSAMRLSLGTVLILIGLLQLLGKVSFQVVSDVTNPFVLGAFLPWIISFSPCVLPFLSAIIVGGALSANAVASFFLFGIGLLTPAVVISFLGNRALNSLKKYSNVMSKVEKWSAVLIIVSGFYLSSQLIKLDTTDVWIAGIILLAQVIVIAYVIFKKPTRRTMQNYLLIAVIFIASLVVISHTTFIANQYSREATVEEFICNSHVNSPIALEAAIAFSITPTLLGGTLAISGRTGKRIRFTIKKD